MVKMDHRYFLVIKNHFCFTILDEDLRHLLLCMVLTFEIGLRALNLTCESKYKNLQHAAVKHKRVLAENLKFLTV